MFQRLLNCMLCHVRFSPQPQDTGQVIIPNLQMKKLKLKEAKLVAQGHPTYKGEPRQCDFKACTPNAVIVHYLQFYKLTLPGIGRRKGEDQSFESDRELI